jgi:hypothetical protein
MGSRSDLAHDWRNEVRSLTLSTAKSIRRMATENMVVLPLTPEGVLGSVESALRELSLLFHEKALASRVGGYFYAWIDEVSGTLRCSFCEVPEGGALPFACPIDCVTDMCRIVEIAKSTSYAGGIPWRELSVADSFAPPSSDQMDVPIAPLVVYGVYVPPVGRT